MPEWWFWLYLACWLPFVLCLTFYGLRSPWRSSVVGRGLFTLYGSIVAILTLVLVVILDPGMPPEIRDSLRIATLSGVAVAGWVQLKNILKLQRQRSSSPTPTRRVDDPR